MGAALSPGLILAEKENRRSDLEAINKYKLLEVFNKPLEHNRCKPD